MFASISSTVLAATAIIGTAGLAFTPASAAPFDMTRSVAVDHRDLDLASADGAAALQNRIKRATVQVCGSADPRDLAALSQRNACRASALLAAQPKMEVAIANARGNTRFASNAPAIHVAAH